MIKFVPNLLRLRRHATTKNLAGLCAAGLIAVVTVFGADFDAGGSQRKAMMKETRFALEAIQNFHYSKRPLKEIDAGEILTNYMGELDYNRLFFLRSDKEEILLRFEDTLMSPYLSKGDLYPAFQIFTLYKERALNRLEWIFEELKGDFTFDGDDTYAPDRSEAEWPAAVEDADHLWRARLKYELIAEVLGDLPLADAKEKVERRYRRTEKYIKEIEPSNVQELFLTAVANMYDPHSTFLSADTLEEFSNSMKNSLVGIGALLRDEDGLCIIQELIAGGPAETSGHLYPGDTILGVAQGEEGGEMVDIVDMKLKHIVKMIRGEKGTTVRLNIAPAGSKGTSARKVVALVRDQIQLTENLAKAEIIEVPAGESETVAVGRIELPSFYGKGVGENEHSSTSNDVEELLKKLEKAGVKGVVLDLRRNGGGLLKEAIDLAGLFIEKGPVVQVKDTTGRIREDLDLDPKIAYDGPLIVLVSRRSASASEIVAGALQDHRRALIVGDTTTHGKGTVQIVHELGRGRISWQLFENPQRFGATKVTIQKFYLPNGESTQHQGVRSDIVIPSINEFLPIGESDLPNALAWDSIRPLKWINTAKDAFPEAEVNEPLIARLQELSAARMKALEEFGYLQRQIARFKERDEKEEFSLSLEKRRAERVEDERFREEMEKLRDALAEDAYPHRDVLLTISEAKEAQHQEKLRNSTLPNGKPRANRYYQKVFYYQPEGEDEIVEVWVENFNYEKLLKKSEELSAFLAKLTGKALDPEVLHEILMGLKNGENSADYQFRRLFREAYEGVLTEEKIAEVLPAFFKEMIRLEPSVLYDRPKLDIPLREGLRVMGDWLAYIEAKKGAVTAQVRPGKAPAEKEAPAAVAP